MKVLPIQMIIVELENGRRGVFLGRPLVFDADSTEDCQVENVWFSNIQDMPPCATLEQMTRFAMDQVLMTKKNLQ